MKKNDNTWKLEDLAVFAVGLLNRINKTPTAELMNVGEDILTQLHECHYDEPEAAERIANSLFRPDHALATVLQTHLLVEYCIDHILITKMPNFHSVTAKREYSFSAKLDFAYSANLIPEHLYDDLKTINRIRNQYAHKIDFDIADVDLSRFNWVEKLKNDQDEDREILRTRVLLSFQVIAYFLIMQIDSLYPLQIGGLEPF